MNALRLAALGLLAMPLTLAAMPVYLYAPAFYTGQLGLPLALTGWLILLTRLFDLSLDPLLGRVIDRLERHQLAGWMLAGVLVLSIGFAALWNPPLRNTSGLALCLFLSLLAVYLGHTMLNLLHLAWCSGAPGEHERVRAVSCREAAGLFGLLLASFAFAWLTRDAKAGLWLAIAFAMLLAVLACLFWRSAPAGWMECHRNSEVSWHRLLKHAALYPFWLIYACNALAMALPSTLVVFYIRDHLQAPDASGVLLALYFLSAAAGLPCWAYWARRFGPLASWRYSMLLAITAFISVLLLGTGQTAGFAVICLFTGFTLAADLVMPTLVLTDLIGPHADRASYLGLLNLLGKLAVALAAFALPLLAWIGYVPGSEYTLPLVLLYAAVPCCLKLLAWCCSRPLLQALKGVRV